MLTGSLSSILQSMDQSNAALAEKMLYLNRLQNQYGVGGELYNEIKKTLNYDSKMAVAELSNFIEQLPPQLKVSVAITMYKETFDTHTFFIGMKNTQLLTIMGQNFRPQFYQVGQYLYRQGDEISTIQIMQEGVATFVQPRYHNAIFAIIDNKKESINGCTDGEKG